MSLDEGDRAAFDALTAELGRDDPRFLARTHRRARLDAVSTVASHPVVIALLGACLVPFAMALGSVTLGALAVGCLVVGRQRSLRASPHPDDGRLRRAGLLPTTGEVTRRDTSGTPVAHRTLLLPPRLLRTLLLPLIGVILVVAW